MGKFFKILGIIFLVLIVLVVGGLFFGHSKGDEKMREFYDLIASNDPQKFLDECSPEVSSKIDPPVLKMWMEGFNSALGKYDGLSGTDFNINYNSTNGQEILELRGTANFEKGQAKTYVQKINGKITDLSIDSPEFTGDAWLTEPPKDFYKARAIKFMSMLTDNPPNIAQARDMLTPALEKQLPLVSGQKGMKEFLDIYGTRKSLKVTGNKFVMSDEKGNRSLTLFLKYTGQKKTCDAHVTFAFEKLGSIIYSFKIPEKPAGSKTQSPSAGNIPVPLDKLHAFFGAIESEQPNTLIALCDPRIESEFDPPILQAWMKAFNNTLGRLETLDDNFSTTKKDLPNGSLVSLIGNIKCSKGTADMKLQYLNDKIISFNITSEKLDAAKWFENVDMSFCNDKGKAFLTYLVGGQTEKAGAMMMEQLRKKFTKTQIDQAMAKFREKYGLPEKMNITKTETQTGPNTKLIRIDYDYIGKKEKCKAYVKFIINGLKTEVVGFEIPT